MKSPEEFSRDVHRKAAVKRTHRKQLLTLAIALPVIAAGVVAVRFALPVLTAQKNSAAQAADYSEAAGEETQAMNGPYTLEIAPGKLMDLSYRALEGEREKLYEEVWQNNQDVTDKEKLIELQNQTDEKFRQLEEEFEQQRQQAESLGLTRDQNLLDWGFPQAVAGLTSRLAPQLLSGEENGCVSPLSLYLALALLEQGARGETQTDLLSLLGAENSAWLADQCGRFIRQTYAENDLRTLKIENSLWASDRLQYVPEYLTTASEDFYTSLFRADFTDPALGEAVSAWISENTKGLLQPQLEFDPDTVLALVNTLYFYEQWDERFSEDQNTVEDFTLPDGTTQKATYMHTHETIGRVYLGEKFTLARLALKEGDWMLFVLPDEGVSPDDLLTDPELQAVLAGQKEDDFIYPQVQWSVPKFSIDSSFDLAQALKALGLTDAFDPDKADFTGLGMAPEGDLYLSQARQDVHIGIDEQGVEAAAFTMLAMAAGAALPPDEIVQMDLNRPFLFAVVSDTLTSVTEEAMSRAGTVLYYGVCAQPEVGKDLC